MNSDTIYIAVLAFAGGFFTHNIITTYFDKTYALGEALLKRADGDVAAAIAHIKAFKVTL